MLKDNLKKISLVLFIYWLIYGSKNFFRFKLISFFRNWIWFWKDFFAFKRINNNLKFIPYFQPELLDKTTTTYIEPIYFYQDTWLACKLSAQKPTLHVDVGSKAMSLAIISQFVPVQFIDIRPIEYQIPNFECVSASILSLPFDNDSKESISSICVIEHIGLGRYGDPLDPFGSEKSFKELQRVLAIGGDFYFTVPVDTCCKYCFNAHRTFTREYILELNRGLELIEEKYLYSTKLYSEYVPNKGFGTGFFHFRK